MPHLKKRSPLRFAALPALLFALSGAPCRGQNQSVPATLVGYEPFGYNTIYPTDLRDELFSPTPLGGSQAQGIGLGYTEVFCSEPHLFCRIAADGGVEMFDAGLRRKPGAFNSPPNTSAILEQASADPARVIAVGTFDFCAWERKSRRLLCHWNFRRAKDDEVALTSTFYAPRAGVILQAAGPQLRTWSAQTGQLLRLAPHPLADFDAEFGEAKDASHVVFSPDARECFYNTTITTSQPDPKSDENEPRDGPPGPIHVASCASGRTLWTIAPAYTLVFGGDGATVLAQKENSPLVEVRAARTGKVLRQIHIRPDCTFLGSSIDGRTLYTHDQTGRVWKQGLG